MTTVQDEAIVLFKRITKANGAVPKSEKMAVLSEMMRLDEAGVCDADFSDEVWAQVPPELRGVLVGSAFTVLAGVIQGEL